MGGSRRVPGRMVYETVRVDHWRLKRDVISEIEQSHREASSSLCLGSM